MVLLSLPTGLLPRVFQGFSREAYSNKHLFRTIQDEQAGLYQHRREYL